MFLYCVATAPDLFLSERCTQTRRATTQVRLGRPFEVEASAKETSGSLCPPTTHAFSRLVPYRAKQHHEYTSYGLSDVRAHGCTT